MTDELDKPIGTKEATKLSAGSVYIKQVTIEPPKEGSKARLVVLHSLHPDREELIRMSAIKTKKVQGKNETISKDTLWYNLDEDGNIRKNTAVAQLLSFYGKTTLRQLENSSVITELDSTGYLAVKAY